MWPSGGDTAFLMAFVNPRLSVYQIRRQHRNEEVRELILERAFRESPTRAIRT
jgi:hypothetical protein